MGDTSVTLLTRQKFSPNSEYAYFSLHLSCQNSNQAIFISNANLQRACEGLCASMCSAHVSSNLSYPSPLKPCDQRVTVVGVEDVAACICFSLNCWAASSHCPLILKLLTFYFLHFPTTPHRSLGLVCCSGWVQLGNECLTRMYPSADAHPSRVSLCDCALTIVACCSSPISSLRGQLHLQRKRSVCPAERMSLPPRILWS